jgi:predicted ribosome quality control (RQC) complex YloA/Tae2 family protein
MKIKLYLNKSVHENAALYYEQSKDARKKREGVKKAIEQTKKEIKEAQAKQKKEKKIIKVSREKKWFEKFHWFTTTEGRLAVGGRNAQQNDIVFSKYMDEADLFFHADIQGGSALILKDGTNASEKEQLEAAQFAASFSNAWKNANASVNVYAVKKEQVSKHAQGGFIAKGAFAITGERTWFNNTRLGLKIGKTETGMEIVPAVSKRSLELELSLLPSKTGKEKGALSKSLAKRYDIHPDEFLEILPNGKTKVL